MKKIISLIITVLLLVSCFSLIASASEIDEDYYEKPCELPADKIITFSEDYKTLYVGEQAYSRFNTHDAYFETEYTVVNKIINHDETVSEVDLLANKKGNVIDATISYTDGAQLWCSFMENSYLDEYENIIKDNVDALFVDFSSDKKQYFKIEIEKLKSKKVTLKTEDFYYDAEPFYVYAITSDKNIELTRGEIYILPDKAYYESSDMSKGNSGIDGEEWTLYEIQDKKIIEELNLKVKEYYSEWEYGTFMDEEISKNITIPFFWICFIFIPIAVMAMSIIFFVRSKTKIYKRIYLITGILATVQTVIFIICNFILFK